MINTTFKSGKVFIGSVTAGDPTINKTEEYIRDMVRAGADMIKISIPFSDPVAEAPIAQAANIRAISAGITVDDVFALVDRLKDTIDTPVILSTYLNPVFNYGYDAFCSKCSEVGVSGMIVLDMPYEEKQELESIANQNNIILMPIVATESEQRIQMICQGAKGFVYVVPPIHNKHDLTTMITHIRKYTALPIVADCDVIENANVNDIVDGQIDNNTIDIIGTLGKDANMSLYKRVLTIKQAV